MLMFSLLLPNIYIMRLAIALSPLNIFLLILMLLSPFLGRKTREYLNDVQKEQTIEQMVHIIASTENTTESTADQENHAIRTEKPTTKTQSTKAVAEEIPLGQNLIAKYREKGKTSPRSLRNPQTASENLYTKDVIIEPEKNQTITEAQADEETKKELFEKIRKYAKTQDQENAEKVFMETLENLDITPLETLERLATFREHFQKLSTQLSS